MTIFSKFVRDTLKVRSLLTPFSRIPRATLIKPAVLLFPTIVLTPVLFKIPSVAATTPVAGFLRKEIPPTKTFKRPERSSFIASGETFSDACLKDETDITATFEKTSRLRTVLF